MDGMGFLLNSLGIDPEQIKSAAAQVQEVATDFKGRLERIEKNQGKILAVMNAVLQKVDPVTWASFKDGVLTNGTGSSSQSGGTL